jgi:hypothetical protein
MREQDGAALEAPVRAAMRRGAGPAAIDVTTYRLLGVWHARGSGT